MLNCTYTDCPWTTDKGNDTKDAQALRMHITRKHTVTMRRKYRPRKRVLPTETPNPSQKSAVRAGYNVNFCTNCGCPMHIVQTALTITNV